MVPSNRLQVASKYMPQSSLIIGVDLAPIKPIPNIITFQDDITTEKCRQNLRQEMKTWKADVVLHDGAPNVGTAWAQDAFTQSELVLMSLKLATEFLIKGGTYFKLSTSLMELFVLTVLSLRHLRYKGLQIKGL